MAKNGRYEAPGQTPIVVTNGGELSDDRHGPWVYFHLDLPGQTAKPMLWLAFEAMCREAGYKLVDATASQPDGP